MRGCHACDPAPWTRACYARCGRSASHTRKSHGSPVVGILVLRRRSPARPPGERMRNCDVVILSPLPARTTLYGRVMDERLRAVCDLMMAQAREMSGLHEYDGRVQDLSPDGVRRGAGRAGAARRRGPLADPHEEAHLAAFEESMRVQYGELRAAPPRPVPPPVQPRTGLLRPRVRARPRSGPRPGAGTWPVAGRGGRRTGLAGQVKRAGRRGPAGRRTRPGRRPRPRRRAPTSGRACARTAGWSPTSAGRRARRPRPAAGRRRRWPR